MYECVKGAYLAELAEPLPASWRARIERGPRVPAVALMDSACWVWDARE